jgi:hypothetical protein
MSRADTFTPLSGTREIYSDFLVNLDSNPMTGALGKISNEAAVRRSIMNLITTNMGERMFQPNLGSDVYRALFEPLDQIAASSLQRAVKNVITYHEPRANLLSVTVYPGVDRNTMVVNVIFSLINSNKPVSLDVILRRVR